MLASALDRDDPATVLRELVTSYLDAGVPPDDLDADLTGLRLELRSRGRDLDEDVVLDIQDQLVGWCAPGARLMPAPMPSPRARDDAENRKPGRGT